MKSRRFWVLLFAVVLAAAACGGDNGSDPPTSSSDQSPDDNSVDNGGTDDGGDEDGSSNAGNTSSPSGTAFPEGIDEDFPVSVPAGWEIDIYEELAEQGVTVSAGVQVLYANDEFGRIVAFYDDWTGTDTADYVRSEAGDMIIYSRTESPVYTITVTKNHEERDSLFTYLLITVLGG